METIALHSVEYLLVLYVKQDSIVEMELVSRKPLNKEIYEDRRTYVKVYYRYFLFNYDNQLILLDAYHSTITKIQKKYKYTPWNGITKLITY